MSRYYDIRDISDPTIAKVAFLWAAEDAKLRDVDWIAGKYHLMAPLSDLQRIREFRRDQPHHALPDSDKRILGLKEKQKAEGFTQPLHVEVYQSGKDPVLSEGNHRLVAAEQLGIKEIPVVFFFYRGW